jgi:hypothetical protein
MLEEGEIVDRSTELLLGKKMKRYLLLGGLLERLAEEKGCRCLAMPHSIFVCIDSHVV